MAYEGRCLQSNADPHTEIRRSVLTRAEVDEMVNTQECGTDAVIEFRKLQREAYFVSDEGGSVVVVLL